MYCCLIAAEWHMADCLESHSLDSSHIHDDACIGCAEAPRDFQEQQTQRLIQSISAGEGPSWRHDQQYSQFLQGRPPPPVGQASGVNGWADEFNAHASASRPEHMPQGNERASDYQASVSAAFRKQNGRPLIANALSARRPCPFRASIA